MSVEGQRHLQQALAISEKRKMLSPPPPRDSQHDSRKTAQDLARLQASADQELARLQDGAADKTEQMSRVAQAELLRLNTAATLAEELKAEEAAKPKFIAGIEEALALAMQPPIELPRAAIVNRSPDPPQSSKGELWPSSVVSLDPSAFHVVENAQEAGDRVFASRSVSSARPDAVPNAQLDDNRAKQER